MKRNEAFPGKYLCKEDCDAGDLTLTMGEVYHAELSRGQDMPDETCCILPFDDSKPMVLNQTHWDQISDHFGEDTEGWVGKQISLFHDEKVKFGKKRVGGLRVRPPGFNGHVVKDEAAGPTGDNLTEALEASASPKQQLADAIVSWTGFTTGAEIKAAFDNIIGACGITISDKGPTKAQLLKAIKHVKTKVDGKISYDVAFISDDDIPF